MRIFSKGFMNTFLLKIRFLLVFAVPVSVSSQSLGSLGFVADSLFADSFPNSVYISVGGGVVALPQGKFIDYLYNNAVGLQLPEPEKNKPDGFGYLSPTGFYHVSAGIELTAINFPRIKHIIESGYAQMQGNYSYSGVFQVKNTSNFYDNYSRQASANYLQNTFYFGYKFQPSTKKFFVSFAGNV